MRHIHTKIAVVLFTTMLGTFAATTTGAQKYQSPTFNSCIRQFYDASMYNWFSYENTCSQTLSITYIANKPPYGSYSADIRPGRKTSTGWDREEVDQRGGFFVYVCPENYLPVDGQDRFVTRPNVQFRCKLD